MLAQILKEMWVDPEVLEALCEEQRRILFLKMREEQVRRWREREETEEREEREEREGLAEPRATPRKAGLRKRVSWLPGLDGDVCVHVIGEVDEFRSSKLLKTLGNKRLQSVDMSGLISGIQNASLLSEREPHRPGIRLLLNGDSMTRCHDTSKDSEEEDGDSGSAEDDPKDPGEDGSDSDSGSGTDDPKAWGLYRTRPRSTSSLPPLSPKLSITDQLRPQDRGMLSLESGEQEVFGSRVARLRRAFAGSASSGGPTSPAKPPLPSKPFTYR